MILNLQSTEVPCGSVAGRGKRCLVLLVCGVAALVVGCTRRGDGVDRERAAMNRCVGILERTRTGIWGLQSVKAGAVPWRVAIREVIARDRVLGALISEGVAHKQSSVLLSTNLAAWSDISGGGTEVAVLLMEPLTGQAGRTFIGIRFNGELVRMGVFP